MVRCSTMQYNAVQCSTMTHKVGSIQGSIRGVKSSHVDTSRLRYRFTMLLAGRIYLPLQGRRTRVPVGRDALPRSPAAACTRLQLAGRCAWRCVAAREGTREGKGVHKRCHAASPARASSRVMPCLPPPPLGAPTTSLPLPAPPPLEHSTFSSSSAVMLWTPCTDVRAGRQLAVGSWHSWLARLIIPETADGHLIPHHIITSRGID